MLLDRLKKETADLHASVERRLDLVSPSLTIERYARTLAVFREFYEPWEQAIEDSCPAQYAALWSGRRKAYRLGQDLNQIGYAGHSSLPAAPPRGLDRPSAWLGSLYVMEGATLGGRFIAQHLESCFGWREGSGYSFFQSYGRETGIRWRALCEELTGAASLLPANRIVASAHHTFALLDEWIRTRL